MPTPNYPARSSGDQTVNYLRCGVDFTMGQTGIKQLGTLPAGAAVLRAYTVTKTVFNNTTNNTLKIGTVATDTGITSALSVATVGVTAATITASTAMALPVVDTPLIVTLTGTGASAATTGDAQVIVEYCPVA
jgi:hypothetical protein